MLSHLLWPEYLLYFSDSSEKDKLSFCVEGLVVTYLIASLLSKPGSVSTMFPAPGTVPGTQFS